MGHLVNSDIVLARDYAACQARHRAAVEAYETALAKIAEAREKVGR